MKLYCNTCKTAIDENDAVYEQFTEETYDHFADYADPTCPKCGDGLTDECFVCDHCEKAIPLVENVRRWWYDGAIVCHECFRMLCKENPTLQSPMTTIIDGIKKISGGVI